MASETRSAQEYIEQLCNEYVEWHIQEQERDKLIEEYNIEKRDVKGYHGREILELLQNADDAYQRSIDLKQERSKELEVRISYKGDVLSVSNTGTFFDEAGIKAIVQGNNSPKKGMYIGNKGTGFRSLLNWATKVQIHSGEWHVRFSREIADRIFEGEKHNKQIDRQLEREPGLRFSMLALPEFIQGETKREETLIKVWIDPTQKKDAYSVESQIDNIDLRTLLFLPNVSRIYIEKENGYVTYERTKVEGERTLVTLRKITEKGEEEEKYYLFRRKIGKAVEEDGVPKDILLDIAVPVDYKNFTAGKLYTFFPLLDADSPFNCIMHASYDLGDHRNTVIRNSTNRRIMREQIRFLFHIITKFIMTEEWDHVYHLLLPIHFLDNKLKLREPFGAEETAYYIKCLRNRKLFLTVNKGIRSLKSGVKLIDCHYPNVFHGESFAELIAPTQVVGIYDLIRAVGDGVRYAEEDLCKKINACSESWTCEEQIAVFHWWNLEYNGKRCLPRLLKKQGKGNSWVGYGEECFFLVGRMQDIHTWARIPILDPEYQKALFAYVENAINKKKIEITGTETKTERLIQQERFYKNTVDFKYYDISTIVSQLSKSVKTYSDGVEFVKWLWNTHGQKKDWKPKDSDTEYNFPAWNSKSVMKSDMLYFGSEYGNFLGDKLFQGGQEPFPPIPEFGIPEELREDFIAFIKKFSVRKYPNIVLQSVAPTHSEYTTEHKNILKGIVGEDITVTSFMLPYIHGLDQILRELSVEEILQWICEDSELENSLRSPYAVGGKILYRYGKKYRDREYVDKIRNYIPMVFNEEKWVVIGEKKYSPKEVLQNIWPKRSQPFEGLLPVLQEEQVKELSENSGIPCDRVIEILKLFAFAGDVTALSSQDFYGLMLQIPEMEDVTRSRLLSRAVYRLVERTDIKAFEASPNQKRFFSEGKLLVKYGDEIKYHPAKDAYLPSTKIVNKKSFPIVEKGMRTNSDNFVVLFGCKVAENECSVYKESIEISPCNGDFQTEFGIFKEYARAYRNHNDNIAKGWDGLKITLVSAIEIKENGKREPVQDEYALIRDSQSNWYIKVSSSSYDSNCISENIETIYSNIANTSGFDAGRLGELFRTKDRKDKEFLIRKDFGDLSVLEDQKYESLFYRSFVETVKKIKADYNTDEISSALDQNSTEEIWKILWDIGADVEDFQKAGFCYTLDLTAIHRKKAFEVFNLCNEKIMDFLYDCAKRSEEAKAQFLKRLDDLKSFLEKMEYRNSIYFDVEEEFVKEFGDWRGERYPSAKKQYNDNYDLLNPDDRFREQIGNDRDAQMMIYFACEEQFEKWLKTEEQKLKDNVSSTGSDPYARFRAMIPSEREFQYTQNGSGVRLGGHHGRIAGAYSQSAQERKQKNQKEFGNIGELLIYNKLCTDYGETNVTMKSEAFVEMKMLPPGLASSGEYDLSYKDHEGKVHFVEVKTGEMGRFFLSKGEMEFAEKHPDCYEVYVVYHMDKEIPDFSVLPYRFWEDESFRCEAVVEKFEVRY